ncbi:molybdopterin-guanine dinucleotide biosynthesis protein B [Tissierella creatinini]|nr:molybdopterin-guanine dinucleotide biosynthesis protein B [Tissierella creatinini]TJX66144.1 molybdopterin-guanine dinucleotide biosynthesis protein B [Soehngenia saccharolytica]
MIPVISIIASKSNVGKTTVLCNIISEIKRRGYRVATIKHDVHGFEIDHPGKDTWLHAQAGADLVAISSFNKMAIIEKLEREYSLDQMIEKINNVDIIITEGYKTEKKPKLEVFRKGISEELYSNEEDLFGIITDAPLDIKVPQFGFFQIDKVVDLIEDKFLKLF